MNLFLYDTFLHMNISDKIFESQHLHRKTFPVWNNIEFLYGFFLNHKALTSMLKAVRQHKSGFVTKPTKWVTQLSLGIRPVWWVFTVRLMGRWGPNLSSCGQRRLWSDLMGSWGPNLSSCRQRRLWSEWADAQANLSLRCAHMPFCWFCHDAAHNTKVKITYTVLFQSIGPLFLSKYCTKSVKCAKSTTIFNKQREIIQQAQLYIFLAVNQSVPSVTGHHDSKIYSFIKLKYTEDARSLDPEISNTEHVTSVGKSGKAILQLCWCQWKKLTSFTGTVVHFVYRRIYRNAAKISLLLNVMTLAMVVYLDDVLWHIWSCYNLMSYYI